MSKVSVYLACIRRALPLLFWLSLMHVLVVYQKEKKNHVKIGALETFWSCLMAREPMPSKIILEML